MNAGALRHLLTIQEPEFATDARTGERVASYADVVDIWCSIKPVAAREIEQSARVVHRATHEIRTRYTVLVTPTCRLKFGTRTFAIVGVVNVDECSRELVIRASEVS